MSELTREEHLRLIQLEIKNLEFLYWSYPKGSARDHYIGVAHTESRRMLDAFYKKWEIEQP